MNEAKLWFWILLDVLIAAIVIAVMGIGLPVAARFGASIPPARTVTVSAQGMTTATPDLAEITFSVVSQGSDPQSLTTDNVNKMNAAIQFLSSQGIASSDIATTGYDLEPTYSYDKNGYQTTISGYQLTETVMVKIHDLTTVASVLGGLAPLGVNEIGGVDFTFNDPDEFVAVARQDALNKAEQKAEQMASGAGAALGEVVSVSENSIVPEPEPVYAMASGAGNAAMPSVAPSPTIQPGSQNVTDSVTITYALR